MRFRGSIAAIACIGAVSCAAPAPKPTPPPPVARPAPTPAPVASPVPIPADGTWMDAPQTPGDWFYRAASGSTAALFGDSGSDARFAITCLKTERRITLARAGTGTQAVPMRIRTETADRALTASPQSGSLPSIIATVSATDPLLDAMAFSKGRFAVEVPGQSTLYLPAWPEITRVIEDCR